MKNQFNNIQEFLSNDSFVGWVLYNQNAIFWQQFLSENPDKETLINEAKQFVLEIRDFEEKELQKLNQKQIWQRINQSISEEIEEKQTTPLQFFRTTTFRWAASVLLVLSFGLAYFSFFKKEKVSYDSLISSIEEKQAWVEYSNNESQPRKIELEDGSVVLLEKNSKLSFPKKFESNKRAVILSGEAFFEITKNPRKPFYVYANEVVTKVLGTSFRVRAFESDKKVTVKVKTGKVSVFSHDNNLLNEPELKGLILLPNQQAIYNRPTEMLSKHLVEAPMPIMAADNENLPEYFDEQPIIKILEVIEKRYGVKILYDEEVLSNCVVTTRLRDESLYEQLDLICTIVGATYKEVDAQIVFESAGCQ